MPHIRTAFYCSYFQRGTVTQRYVPASSAEEAGNLKPCLSVRRSTTAAVIFLCLLAPVVLAAALK
jgi:hypothetical protein